MFPLADGLRLEVTHDGSMTAQGHLQTVLSMCTFMVKTCKDFLSALLEWSSANAIVNASLSLLREDLSPYAMMPEVF